MDIIQDDTHDALTASYQGIEFARLNQVLKESGVKGAKLRRKICTDYFFESGGFLDGGWFVEGEQRFHPSLCFAEVDEAGRLTTKVHLPGPDGGTALHEYAHGTAIWLFEDHKEANEIIETGEIQG